MQLAMNAASDLSQPQSFSFRNTMHLISISCNRIPTFRNCGLLHHRDTVRMDGGEFYPETLASPN